MRLSRRNPLALMVLAVLHERPSHSYQVIQVLKARQKDQAARLNFGSLYATVASLEKAGLIEAIGVTREGNLPLRTTYRTTPAGDQELHSWLADLIAKPVKEYPQYLAALSLLPGVSPAEADQLLTARIAELGSRLAQLRAELAASRIPELFAVEYRYEEALLRADLDFTQDLLERLRSGVLDGLDGWKALYIEDGRTLAQRVEAAFGIPEHLPPSEEETL